MTKHYSATFKAKVVQEMLKEEKTLGQLAAEYGVSTKQLGRWKTHALENLPRLFEPEAEKVQQQHEQQIQELYAEIGRLTTELSWLKKKSGLNPEPR
ncbi:MAG TPA: transposase [Candidatus Saccharimonadales bacterium]|nr:transposase [Candidatus Saccharimonadales bacterium]